jgi:hypothetical protein
MMALKQIRSAACALAWAAAPLLLAQPASAAPDDDRINQLERKLEQSNKLIEQLSERVRQLEAGSAAHPARAAAPAAPAANAALESNLHELEQQVTDMANKPEADHGLDMHGFADVGFAAQRSPNQTGANIGKLDFYLTPNFTDHIKALAELNFECCTGGAIGTDLERLQIGYAQSDALTVWFGRFHTPFGYWNTAFHHGAQLQTTILRPKFLDFEDSGGILPAHTVGIWATGSTRVGEGRFNYDLYAGDAPTINLNDPATAGTGTLDPGLQGAGGRRATFGTNLSYAPNGTLRGLRVGVHALTSEVLDDANTIGKTRVNMFGPWAVYLNDDWEVMVEQYNFRDGDLTGNTGRHASNAGYLQLGRTFSLWTPYARLETASLSQDDAYFAQQESGRSYKRFLGGVRYDLNPKTALKLEIYRTRYPEADVSSYTSVRGQMAVRF